MYYLSVFSLEELRDLNYRKVVVRGTFDHSREIFVMPRSPIESQGQGFRNPGKVQTGANVVTAFRMADSKYVHLCLTFVFIKCTAYVLTM